MRQATAWVAALALLALAEPTQGQAANGSEAAACDRWVEIPTLHGPYRDYSRAARLLGAADRGPRLFQRTADEQVLTLCEEGPWRRRAHPVPSTSMWRPRIRLLPITSLQHYNSGYPRDANNGAIWTGRGVSAEVAGGIQARWGPLSVQVAPTAAYQENAEFDVNSALVDVARYSRFAYGGDPGHIDWPQRFGEESFSNVQPGQSYVRLDALGFAGGISTENLWWGGATEQPVVLSNTAPGFPHLFFGTSSPLDIGIGRVTGQLVWGRLEESEYFDRRSVNDYRLFALIGGTFEPVGLDGLVIGGVRAFMAIIEDLRPSHLLDPYTGVLNNTLGDNEMLALFLHWTVPESGFRVHMEAGREDHWAGLQDILGEPDHTVGYNVGLEKAARWGSRWVRLHGELFRLQIGPRAFRTGRGIPAFYTHSKSIQGYTQLGQMLGASAGPGSGGERLGAEVFAPWGMAGVFGERTSYDEDALFEKYLLQGRSDGTDRRDLEYTVGVRGVYFLGPLDVRGSASWSHRRNRSFLGVTPAGDEVLTEQNWALEFGLSWRPTLGFPRTPAPVRGAGGDR